MGEVVKLGEIRGRQATKRVEKAFQSARAAGSIGDAVACGGQVSPAENVDAILHHIPGVRQFFPELATWHETLVDEARKLLAEDVHDSQHAAEEEAVLLRFTVLCTGSNWLEVVAFQRDPKTARLVARGLERAAMKQGNTRAERRAWWQTLIDFHAGLAREMRLAAPAPESP